MSFKKLSFNELNLSIKYMYIGLQVVKEK